MLHHMHAAQILLKVASNYIAPLWGGVLTCVHVDYIRTCLGGAVGNCRVSVPVRMQTEPGLDLKTYLKVITSAHPRTTSCNLTQSKVARETRT